MSRGEFDYQSSRPVQPDERWPVDVLIEEDLALTCPSCDADLVMDELFASHRVCESCRRHFPIPAHERLALLADADTFEEITLDRSIGLSAADNNEHRPLGRLAGHPELGVIEDAVVAGTTRINGTEAVVAVLDDRLVGSTLGALVAEKVMLAFEHGLTWRLPVVVIGAGGGLRANPGPLAPVQASRLAASAAQLRLAGVPLVSVLTHPTTGAVYAAIAAHSDIVVSEPGVRLSLVEPHLATDSTGGPSDQKLIDSGWIDAVVDRGRLKSTVGGLLDLIVSRGAPVAANPPLECRSTGPVTWNALAHVRQPERPRAGDFLADMVSSFFELRGDRVLGDDRSIVGGIGRIGSMTVVAAALDQSGGGQEATSVRKLTRMARLAGRLEMPLVLLVDGSGAANLTQESIDVCHHVAGLAEVLALIPVPVISVGLGELRGLTAQAMMNGDRRYMQQNAVSVMNGERPASFESQHPGGHWRPGIRDAGIVLTAHECERLGLIDGVIPEPAPGAHADPAGAIATVTATVLWALADLAGTGQRRLLDTRHRRVRALGQSTPEGLAAVRSELRELQEWQRTLSRSIDVWRDRWDSRGQPFRLSFQRPDLGDLAQRLRARRAELLERTGRTNEPEE